LNQANFSNAYQNLIRQSFRELLVQRILQNNQKQLLDKIYSSLGAKDVDRSSLKTITLETLKKRLESAFSEFWRVISDDDQLERVKLLANSFESDPNNFITALNRRFQKFISDQIASLMLDFVRIEGMEIRDVVEAIPKESLPTGILILLLSGLSSSRVWESATNGFKSEALKKLQTKSAYLSYCHNMYALSTEAALACILTGKSFQNMSDLDVRQELLRSDGDDLISQMQAAGYRVSTWLGKEGYDWIARIGRSTNRSDLLVSSNGNEITATLNNSQNASHAIASLNVESVPDLVEFDQILSHHITEDFISSVENNIKTLAIGTLFGLDTAAHKFGEEGYKWALDNLDKLVSPYLTALSSDGRVLVVVGSDHGISFGLGTADHRRTYDDLDVKYSPLFFCNPRFESHALWMADPTTAYSLVDVKPTISRLRSA
jgi:hypothetical protein